MGSERPVTPTISPQPPSSPRPVSSWRTRLPFFYGWVVVGSVFLTEAFAFGVNYSFAVFFVALVEEFGWSRGATSGVFSTFILVSGLAGVGAGTLIDRFGPARLVPAGGVFLAVGLFASSRLAELWHFYLFFGLICGLGLSFAGWVPTVAVVSRWFAVKRGVALGIAGAGIGLGVVVVVPFCQYLILAFGWRDAFGILALVVLLGIVPQAALLQVGRPEELGLRPDGVALDPADVVRALAQKRARAIKVIDREWASFPWTVASAVRTGRFWFLALAFCFTSLCNQMLWAHQVAYLVDVGFEKMLVASATASAGFVSMPAKLFWGWASDRLGREVAFSLGVTAVLAAIVALMSVAGAPVLWLVLSFAVLFGTGYAVSAPVQPAAAADIFVGRNFGGIFGVIAVGNSLGSATGPLLAGLVYDLSGAYTAAFVAAAASVVVAAVLIWLAAPRRVRRVVAGE